MALPNSIPAHTWKPHADEFNLGSPDKDALAGCLDPSHGYNEYEMEIGIDYSLRGDILGQNTTLTLQGVAYVAVTEDADQFIKQGPKLKYNVSNASGTEWQIASATKGTSSSRCITFTFAIALPPAGTIGGPKSGISIHFDPVFTPYHFVVTDAHLDGDISLPSSTHTLNSTSTSPSPYSSSSTGNASPTSEIAQSSSVNVSDASPTSEIAQSSSVNVSDASPTSEITQSSSANVSSSRKSTPARTVALAVIIPLLVLGLAAAALLYWRRRRQQRMAPSAAFRAATGQRYADPDPPMIERREGQDTVSVAETELPGYAAGASSGFGAAQPRGYVSGDEKRPFLGLRE